MLKDGGGDDWRIWINNTSGHATQQTAQSPAQDFQV
jgi:hypothetical protein